MERQEVLQRACDFLANREHSRKELKYKLARTCKDDVLINELLEKLTQEGLQSDERFTESFVHHRINKGQGPIKIEQELRQRGVEHDVIHTFLYSGSVDWHALAEDARAKKFGKIIPGDLPGKAKQSRFLYSRGFGSEVISRILKE